MKLIDVVYHIYVYELELPSPTKDSKRPTTHVTFTDDVMLIPVMKDIEMDTVLCGLYGFLIQLTLMCASVEALLGEIPIQ